MSTDEELTRYVVRDLEVQDDPDCLAVDGFFKELDLDTNGVHRRRFDQAMSTPHVLLVSPVSGICAFCQTPGGKHVPAGS